MASPFQQWLTSAELPTDAFQIVGLPRFYPDRDELRTAIRNTNRTLHGYQQHSNPAVIGRARELQMLLAEAEQALRSDDAWRSYEDRIAESLAQQFQSKGGPLLADWQIANLRRWLETVQDVHPSRIGELVQRVQTAAKRPAANASAPAAASVGRTSAAPTKAGVFFTPRRKRIEAEPATTAVITATLVNPTGAAQPPAIQPPKPPLLLPASATPRGGSDHSLLWILGSAVISVVLLLGIVVAVVAARASLGRPASSPKQYIEPQDDSEEPTLPLPRRLEPEDSSTAPSEVESEDPFAPAGSELPPE